MREKELVINIRKALKEGFTAKWIAQRFGVALSTVYRWKKRTGTFIDPVKGRPPRSVFLSTSRDESLSNLLKTSPRDSSIYDIEWTAANCMTLLPRQFNYEINSSNKSVVSKRIKFLLDIIGEEVQTMPLGTAEFEASFLRTIRDTPPHGWCIGGDRWSLKLFRSYLGDLNLVSESAISRFYYANVKKGF